MKRFWIVLFCILNLFQGVYGQKADFNPPKDVPRNIVIIMANGMGISQVSAATLKKGSLLSFTTFPVTGFTQTWSANDKMPSDSTTAKAVATNEQEIENSNPVAKNKNIFDWAKEQKMLTGIITTGSVTGVNPRIFCLDHPQNKDDEAIAADYLSSDINVLIGGGSKYFDKRYDGRNLFNEFRRNKYLIENNARQAGKITVPRTIALISKEGLYGASARKDLLPQAALSATRTMTNADGYLLLIDNTKIEEADSLNNIKLLTDEILDIDKLVQQIEAESAGQTLILVVGNYESGGLVVQNGTISKGAEPVVTWNGRKPTAALAPVFATGPGALLFSGTYSLSEIYKKLETLMVKRR
jgi:alkaline phosphatase